MKLYSSNDNYKLYQGNMLDMLDVIEPESIDSIVTDPPYELNFMNKGWDNSGIAFQKGTWEKCYDVLKPGGYLLAFGGSRTYHRIACAIEDAGFEIRDTIMWLYGEGFPKSMDISKQIDRKLGAKREIIGKMQNPASSIYSMGEKKLNKDVNITAPATDLAKQWDGWGTALKPSFEPIIVARKPFKGSLVDNVIQYGVGGINIDECRVKTDEELRRTSAGFCSKSDIFHNDDKYKVNTFETSDKLDGRFPANTILTYDDTDFDEVCGGFPDTKDYGKPRSCKPKNNILFNASKISYINSYNDEGSASRYFYCAKANKKDRNEGLELFKNIHPTVKPTELMQYLVKLVTPNGGTILDPFNGSGSTGKAVMYENKEENKNYNYIGIELTEEYLPIAKARIEYLIDIEKENNQEKNTTKQDGQLTIFDFGV